MKFELDDSVQMGTAKFWPAQSAFPTTNEEGDERAFELYWHATQVLRAEEHDRALIAPKLISKERVIAAQSGPEFIFEARAVAAQIGWLETSLPAAAAQALHAVEDLLSSEHSEASVAIYHQLKMFEAREHGLLATWETPEALVCVPTSAGAIS